MDLHCTTCIKHIVSPIQSALFIVLLLAASSMFPALATAEKTDAISQFNRQYEQLAAKIYQARERIILKQQKPAASMAELDQQVDRYLGQQDVLAAVGYLRANMALMKDNIDDRMIFKMIRILLDNNDREAANILLDYIQAEGEKSLISNVAFIFASHAMQQNNWPAVIEYTQGILADLTEQDAAYARLIRGVALQKQKQHRDALPFYEAIPESSLYYPAAQLNRAIAFLRQGWWSDAQRTINHAIQSQTHASQQEMINRLNLVLGYAMLQQEYYRDARDAFGRVDLNSEYSNRALLGLALSAANQTDYVGALNALDRLNKKTSIDLSVEESHLLLGYIYQKLQQQMTASATYSKAIEHYRSRIEKLDAIANSDIQFDDQLSQLSEEFKRIQIQDTVLNYGDRFPAAFFRNLVMTQRFISSGSSQSMAISKQLQQQLRQLHQRGRKILAEVSRNLLEQRKEYLSSYLNQCRFGLANLYDNALFNDK